MPDVQGPYRTTVEQRQIIDWWVKLAPDDTTIGQAREAFRAVGLLTAEDAALAFREYMFGPSGKGSKDAAS